MPMLLRSLLITLGVAYATHPMPALAQSKDAAGVPRSVVQQGIIAAKDVLANILESGRFEFVFGEQWYFDKRIMDRISNFVIRRAKQCWFGFRAVHRL
jgi:hypothetical protein